MVPYLIKYWKLYEILLNCRYTTDWIWSHNPKALISSSEDDTTRPRHHGCSIHFISLKFGLLCNLLKRNPKYLGIFHSLKFSWNVRQASTTMSKFWKYLLQKVSSKSSSPMQEDGNWGKGWWEARGAHHNTRTRSYLTMDVSSTLHAKPLGVSMTWSAQLCEQGGEQGGEQEGTVGKGAGGGG
jgi:hypothetical protein